MNSKLLFYLNIVLLVAVGFLYYLHFSSSSKSISNASTQVDSLAKTKPVVLMPKEIKASKIVYINSDVLNEKYEFVRDLTSAASAKQTKLEAIYQSKGQKLQQDYADFQQKASQGLMSENQSNAAQEDLMKRKEELERMEGELQLLMEEIQKNNEEVRKKVVDYVAEYNKTGKYNYILTYTNGPGGVVLLANDSLDITSDIVNGLNAQYKVSKKK